MALEAYDFSRFQERDGSAAPAAEPKIQEQPQRQSNVVELPEQPEQQRQAQPQHRRSPLKMAAAALCFGLIFLTALSAVHSEVQLTELAEEINMASKSLEEAKSREIQLSMQAAQKMTDAEVEEYAVQQLGMSKLSNAQVTYLHVAGQDQGKVVQDVAGGSWLDQFLSTVRSWLAG